MAEMWTTTRRCHLATGPRPTEQVPEMPAAARWMTSCTGIPWRHHSWQRRRDFRAPAAVAAGDDDDNDDDVDGRENRDAGGRRRAPAAEGMILDRSADRCRIVAGNVRRMTSIWSDDNGSRRSFHRSAPSVVNSSHTISYYRVRRLTTERLNLKTNLYILIVCHITSEFVPIYFDICRN